MGINLIFQIILNQPGHDNDRLPDHKQEKTTHESHQYDEPGIDQNTPGKNVINVFLKIDTLKRSVYG